MADTRASDEYLDKHGLDVEEIDLLCQIKDNRSVATASFDRREKSLIKLLIGQGCVTRENYANGEFNLLTDKGNNLVDEYNRLAEADYEAITAEREAAAKERGYRLFGNAINCKAGQALFELHEATICSTPKGLRDLAAHLLEVATQMEKTPQHAIDTGMHWHFQPEVRPEIVICGIDTASKLLPPIIYDEETEGWKR